MVQQNIVAAEFLEQVLRFGGEPQLARGKRLELEVGMRRLLVDIEQAREIHRPVDRKHLPGLQFEIGAQALDDFGIGIGFNLQPHRISFAAVVQFGAHRFQQVARFFFRQIEIAVAGDAEGGGGNNVVAVIHPRGVVGDQISQKNEVDRTLRGQPNQSRQGAGHGDHAGVGERGTAAPAEQKGHAQRLVDHSRKRMRRIHRDRRKQKIEFPLAVFLDESPGAGIQFMQAQNANSLVGQRRPQLIVPAAILVIHKLMSFAGNDVPLFDQGQAVWSGFGVSVFNLLHQSGHAHFEKFVQIAGRDGKKFQTLQQRIFLILRLFEDTAVEGQPGGFPVDVVGRVVEREASHDSRKRTIVGGGQTYAVEISFVSVPRSMQCSGRAGAAGSAPGVRLTMTNCSSVPPACFTDT